MAEDIDGVRVPVTQLDNADQYIAEQKAKAEALAAVAGTSIDPNKDAAAAAPETPAAATPAPPAPAVAPSPETTADGGPSVKDTPAAAPPDPGINGMFKDLVNSSPIFAIAFALFSAVFGNKDDMTPEQQQQLNSDVVLAVAGAAHDKVGALKAVAAANDNKDFHTPGELAAEGGHQPKLGDVIVMNDNGKEVGAVVLKNEKGEITFTTGRGQDGKAEVFTTNITDANVLGVIAVTPENGAKLHAVLDLDAPKAPAVAQGAGQDVAQGAPEVAVAPGDPENLAAAIEAVRKGVPLPNDAAPKGPPPPVAAPSAEARQHRR